MDEESLDEKPPPIYDQQNRLCSFTGTSDYSRHDFSSECLQGSGKNNRRFKFTGAIGISGCKYPWNRIIFD